MRMRLGRIGQGGLLVALGVALAPWAQAASHAHHGDAPSINWWAWSAHAPPVGWFLLDFALFAGALVLVAKKPLARAFSERHLRIKRGIAEAASAHAKASA